MNPTVAPEEEETPWTDDRVRWHEDFVDHDDKKKDDDDDDEEEDCAFIDPFKDPDPFTTFTFSFPLHVPVENNDDHPPTKNSSIDMEIRGYKTGADQVWKSTGLTLWRAAEHLCQYMVKHSDMFKGKRIVELGAGLGLCGILAHRLGGSVVSITDGDSDALVHLRENVNRNKTNTEGLVISAHQLIWGKETTETFLERQGQTFDVLIASDIIYARCIVEPLWETVDILLSSNPQAVFVMAYARREVPVSIEFVLSYAEGAGFSHELVDEHPDGIWVYLFRRKSDARAPVASSS